MEPDRTTPDEGSGPEHPWRGPADEAAMSGEHGAVDLEGGTRTGDFQWSRAGREGAVSGSRKPLAHNAFSAAHVGLAISAGVLDGLACCPLTSGRGVRTRGRVRAESSHFSGGRGRRSGGVGPAGGGSGSQYERRALGGKCRSIPVPGTGRDGRRDLPGEHGFRIFFGFYQDLPDTLRRIPFPGNANGVHDNLLPASEFLASFSRGREDLRVPLTLPDGLLRQVRAAVETAFHLPPHEAAVFAQRVLVYLTSCEERRLGQWEHTTWPDFLRAGQVRRLPADLRPRVDARAQLDQDGQRQRAHRVPRDRAGGVQPAGPRRRRAVDRVLNLPTNDAWIDPWRHLRDLGVEFRLGWEVEDLVVDGGRIWAVRTRDPPGARGVGRRRLLRLRAARRPRPTRVERRPPGGRSAVARGDDVGDAVVDRFDALLRPADSSRARSRVLHPRAVVAELDQPSRVLARA